MRILVDTNILLRAVEPGHAQHAQVIEATDMLRRQGHVLCLVPQNIYEFWVVATRPRDVNGLAMSPTETESAVLKFLRLFTLLRDERTIFEQWFELVVQNEVRGVKAHDARLAAAMQRHGIQHVLTFNAADFQRYSHISILKPEEVSATA